MTVYRLSLQADADLDEIADYIARQNPAAAVCAVPFAIDAESFGVLEPGGTLHLIAKRSGAVLSTTQVEVPPRLSQIHTAQDERRSYVVLFGVTQDLGLFQVKQVREDRNLLVNGPLYAFDPQSGQRLWKSALRDCAFAIDQPKDIPFLVCGYQVTEAVGPKVRKTTSILRLIDKSTGEELFRHEGTHSHVYYTLVPKNTQVDIRRPKQNIRVDYAPQPQPDE